jgi:nitrate reductase gamma subunit/ferredoxin
MSARVEASLLPELARFGAGDVSACFNCGTCSAVCPLTSEDGAFPRRIIRFAQLGMRDELLASPELWTCFGCAECTASCPRQADPAEFMAAARRYAVASYDRTTLARRLATSPVFSGIFIGLLVAVLAAFMYSAHRPVDGSRLALFEFIPPEFVHDLGIGVMAVFGLATVAGLVAMVRRVFRRRDEEPRRRGGVGDAVRYAVVTESLAQTRFRRECTEEEAEPPRPWFLRRWFVHAATMWGFLGLLGATIADFVLGLLGVKPTGTSVPIWYPVRLLGTVAGLLLVYGTTILIWRRLRRSDRSSARSAVSDWSFLWLLWVSGVTGFALELALYLPDAPGWGYGMFLVHVAVAMALVLLAPFGKFAHAIYRPVALAALRLRARARAGSGTDDLASAA